MDLYAWTNTTYNATLYTSSPTPSIGDDIYNDQGVIITRNEDIGLDWSGAGGLISVTSDTIEIGGERT